MIGSDIGGKIRGAVFALVAGIVILYLVPVNFQAADSLNRQFYPHCKIGSDSVRFAAITGGSGTAANAFPASVVGTVVPVVNKSGKCSIAARTAATPAWSGASATASNVDLRADNGTDFTIRPTAGTTGWSEVADLAALTQFGSTAVWQTPGEVMTRFQGINRLVTAILPVLITVGLFAVVGFGAAKMWRGGDMGSSIGIEVGIVIVVVVVMNLAPSMFEAIIEGSKGNAGQYGVTSQFSGITDLLFGLLPLLTVLSLIGLLGWRAYSGYKSMRSNTGMGM